MSTQGTTTGAQDTLTSSLLGPFESATLRFDVTFPPSYPDAAPTVTFSTDVFHPLVVPLTQYTFSASALDSAGTVSASDDDRVPPGSFSLRQGFPQWYHSRGGQKSARGSVEGPAVHQDEEGRFVTETEDVDPLDSRSVTVQVLSHLRRAFEDEDFLDDLPFSVVGNPSAWHAWRAYRGLAKDQARGRSPGRDEAATEKPPPSSPKQMSDWNWEGVWESRVQAGISSSVSDAGLYTNQGLIRFAKLDKDQLEGIRQQIRAA